MSNKPEALRKHLENEAYLQIEKSAEEMEEKEHKNKKGVASKNKK